jgi:hypothetical protein
MDFALFEQFGDPVPLCEGMGEVDIAGYKLCVQCAEAFEVLAELGLRITKRSSPV